VLVTYFNPDRALADLGLEGWAVSDEPTTPDLLEVSQRVLDAVNRRDVEAFGSLLAPDAVLDRSRIGLEVVQGRDAVPQLLSALWVLFDDPKLEEEELTDFGNEVGLLVYTYRGRPRESAAAIHSHFATVVAGSDGLCDRIITYLDIDDARAAAERLAEERG
jgi:ketosteroid isomerase-like protein